MAIFACMPCGLSDRISMLWWLSHRKGGMSLHNAVGINSKNGATTENQSADCKYMGKGKGCPFDDCVGVI